MCYNINLFIISLCYQSSNILIKSVTLVEINKLIPQTHKYRGSELASLPQCWPRLQCFWIANWFFLHTTQKGLREHKGQIRQADKQPQLLERPKANIHNAEKSCAKEAWLSKRIIGLANFGHDWGKQLEFWYRTAIYIYPKCQLNPFSCFFSSLGLTSLLPSLLHCLTFFSNSAAD